jgi:hypothetical protein
VSASAFVALVPTSSRKTPYGSTVPSPHGEISQQFPPAGSTLAPCDYVGAQQQLSAPGPAPDLDTAERLPTNEAEASGDNPEHPVRRAPRGLTNLWFINSQGGTEVGVEGTGRPEILVGRGIGPARVAQPESSLSIPEPFAVAVPIEAEVEAARTTAARCDPPTRSPGQYYDIIEKRDSNSQARPAPPPVVHQTPVPAAVDMAFLSNLPPSC